jgi:hypothetical protein
VGKFKDANHSMIRGGLLVLPSKRIGELAVIDRNTIGNVPSVGRAAEAFATRKQLTFCLRGPVAITRLV